MENDFKPDKGQHFEMEIEDISNDGLGIGKINGMAIFVKNAVYKDIVVCEITKVKKNYCFAKLVKIIKESPFRRRDYCVYQGRCGGCDYFSLNYEGQLELKEKQARAKLQRIGGFKEIPMEQILGMDDTKGYRNKAKCMISTGGIITEKGGVIKNLGKPMVGFVKQKSHEICDCLECNIQAETVMTVARVIRKFMEEDNITGYDPKWDKGLMKSVTVRTAFNTGEVMVIIHVNGRGIPNHEKLIGMLDEAIYNIPSDSMGKEYSLESVILSYEKKEKSKELEFVTLAGKNSIIDTLGELKYEISPGAFYQVNPVQMKNLYDKVVEFATLKGNENVWDLYCGVGTIGLYMASKVKSVLGIESVKSAVIDANRNAVINGIVNATYLCGNAEREIYNLLNEGKTCDIAILDPPRAGCDIKLLEALAMANIGRIVYASCDPATLARDLKILAEKGYKLEKTACFDMFPETRHVETIALLSKLGSKRHISIEFPLDEMDITCAESKATYK